MKVRFAQERDIEDIIAMGRHNVEQTLPGQPYEPERVATLFSEYLETGNPTFFVCEKAEAVIGFLLVGFGDYDYRSGFFTIQKVLYVKPENRGTRAAVLLTKHLVDWSRELGASEIIGGNDNDFQSDRTSKFLERFGFRKVGYAMSKNLESEHGRQERI